MSSTTITKKTNRTHNQRVNRFAELQTMGWNSYELGKKPLISYTLEKEGETTFKSNTLDGLLDKVEHLQPGSGQSLDQLLTSG